MLGNFTLTLPTRVHFGDQALDALPEELARYGNRVLLTYGGKSAKATGLYDRVIAALADAGKEVREVSGITANPTFTKVLEVARAIREHDADLVLAVGGGSVIDCSKDASALAWQEGTPDELWARFYTHGEQVAPEDRVTPVGCILTIPATGSEMNRSGVTTNE
ncbi:MAG: iron-containing alcohol dehydrogenase, partial [Coriobacteriaceae bacterium]|nr:iron-containing alcohol dehydrogenase [Coriobacteriaceae bacterium]